MNASRTGRIVLLTTSHRVAPGLLSWPAWRALHEADRVLCADPAHPQLPYVREAGVRVETGPLPSARELVGEAAAVAADADGEATGGTGGTGGSAAHGAETAGEPEDGGPRGRTTVVIAAAEGEPQLTDGLARIAGGGRTSMPELELLPGSYDLPGARLLDLVQVMDRIRAECPWSGERTHEGLVKYAIEEAYELVEAIEEGDREALCEELGDVLLQVVFHARIAQEDRTEPFSIDDVAAGIVEKLVNRHPHVFDEEHAETPEDVREHWLRKKAEEKQRDSVTDGIPLGQPALALAAKLAGRARGAGLQVPPEAPAGGAGGGIGYELLALAARAEAEGVDPETALRAAARTYREAVRTAEGAD